MARNAGAVEVSTATTEFTAAMLGWPLRTFEAAVPPDRLGWGWAKFAFTGWISVVLGGSQHLAPSGAERLVLQRHGHGSQAREVTIAFGVEDVDYLLSDTGVDALREIAALRLTSATLVTDIAWARARFGEQAAVLVETTRLRRKAAAKLSDPARWLFTDEALQQATTEPVARHRARRLSGARVQDATCSIGTELVALRDSAALLIGSDIDPVRLAMARHNVAGVDVCRADALRPITRDAVVVLDPAPT